jgi:hypothetical protein
MIAANVLMIAANVLTITANVLTIAANVLMIAAFVLTKAARALTNTTRGQTIVTFASTEANKPLSRVSCDLSGTMNSPFAQKSSQLRHTQVGSQAATAFNWGVTPQETQCTTCRFPLFFTSNFVL